MKIFENGIDHGYMEDADWWFKHPEHRFRIAQLDNDYPGEYFPLAAPPEEILVNITKRLTSTYIQFLERYFALPNFIKLEPTLIEFGAGGGWLLNKLETRGFSCVGVEGSTAGVEFCRKHFPHIVPVLYQHDLRRQIDLKSTTNGGKRFNIGVCTEVAEHIEWPFHSVLVKNIVDHADFIWWSSEGPEVPNRPHLHHVAEAPLTYWATLFDFFGYGLKVLPDFISRETAGRGQAIFYNKSVFK